jgi:hypothetical protein
MRKRGLERKAHAIKAIENGFTSQFTNNVTKRQHGFLPTSRIEAKSTFSIIGEQEPHNSHAGFRPPLLKT